MLFNSNFRELRFGPFRATRCDYAPADFMPTHAHDYFSLSMMARGVNEEIARGCSHIALAGSVTFKERGFEHADRVGPAGMTVVALRWSEGRAWSDSGRSPKFEYEWVSAGPAARLMRRIADELLDLNASDAEVIERAEQAVLNLAEAGNRQSVGSGTWVNEVRDAVHAEYALPISVSSLAERVGRHPVSVARAFRQRFGSSIFAYAHRLRIERALQQIRDPHITLAEVAASIGYADQAHFCRFFRRITGRTPGAYRRLAS